MEVKVTLRNYKRPNANGIIEMSLEEYISFIEEQACNLRMITEDEKPIFLVGFNKGEE